jgi:hypothetical protein
MNAHLELVSGATAAEPSTRCPNCEAPASGKFCAACGESIKVHRPSAREFIHEFIGHYVAAEGKLWQTMKMLVLSPGRLTLEFLRGRRVSHINPLRLYLTMSLIMFGLIKLAGVELPKVAIDDWSYGVSFRHVITDPADGRPAVGTLTIRHYEDQVPTAGSTGQKTVTWAESGAALLAQVNGKWAQNMNLFRSEPASTKSAILNRGFTANLPYMLIAALPLFALYLKLIYRKAGRYYGEHLAFALHTNAFAFLLACVMIVMPGNFAWVGLCVYNGQVQLIGLWDCLQLIPLAWMLAYLPIAMQRVYGGSRIGTLARWLVLISVHLVVIATLVVGAELIAIVGYSRLAA